jgi:hypothetical protein
MNLKAPLPSFILFVLLTAVFTALAPLEKTLGANARIVYLHGAWVWVAMLMFLAATIAGLAALVTRRPSMHRWSRAFSRTAILFWLAFLPMSMYVMQANWNGLFLNEPRFRVPLNFAVVGILLQVGLAFLPEVPWTAAGNLVFGIALFAGMNGIQTVLHPQSPVFSSEARSIQIFFSVILLLLVLCAWQVARGWYMLAVAGIRPKTALPAAKTGGNH